MKVYEDFINYLQYELNYSLHTVVSYENDVKSFTEFIGGEDLASMTVNDMRAWMVEMKRRGLSVSSIKRKMQALRTLFKWAQKRGIVETNPAYDVQMAKTPKRLPTFVRPEQMDQVLDRIDIQKVKDFRTLRNHLLVQMLYETGFRRSEVVLLNDVDVDTRKAEIKVLGKRNKERIVPIGKGLCDAIDKYRKIRNREVGVTDKLFVRENGKEIYPALVYKIVCEALEGLELSKRSPHVLRHTFATSMLNDGAEINSVKELLGHQSLAATQVYTHITTRELIHNYQQAHPRATKNGGKNHES